MYLNGKNISFTDRSNDCVKNYLKNINCSTPLTTEEEYDLWLRMQQNSRQARNQLIFANLRYVVSIAKKYLRSGAEFADLIQAGNEGLVRAVDKFDASRGYRLISFATWYIENEVYKAAYNYIRHDVISLDEPFDAEDERGGTLMDNLVSYPSESTDWNLRYYDALNSLKAKAEKRQYGLGRLTVELHDILLKGYTTSDFAHKHRLNESQMTRLLTILSEETGRPLRSAA